MKEIFSRVINAFFFVLVFSCFCRGKEMQNDRI